MSLVQSARCSCLLALEDYLPAAWIIIVINRRKNEEEEENDEEMLAVWKHVYAMYTNAHTVQFATLLLICSATNSMESEKCVDCNWKLKIPVLSIQVVKFE